MGYFTRRWKQLADEEKFLNRQGQGNRIRREWGSVDLGFRARQHYLPGVSFGQVTYLPGGSNYFSYP